MQNSLKIAFQVGLFLLQLLVQARHIQIDKQTSANSDNNQ